VNFGKAHEFAKGAARQRTAHEEGPGWRPIIEKSSESYAAEHNIKLRTSEDAASVSN